MSSQELKFHLEFGSNSDHDEITNFEPECDQDIVPYVSTFSLLPTTQSRHVAVNTYLSDFMENHNVTNISTALNLLPPVPIPPWSPSAHLQNILNKINNKYLSQYPAWPCAYCGILLYPNKACREIYDNTHSYPLEQAKPDLFQVFEYNNRVMIACCSSCGKGKKCWILPNLPPVPDVISRVPEGKRKYLSPIFLQSSLGRSVGDNTWTTYRSFIGSMGLSRNIRSFVLYAGTLGASLSDNSESQDWNDDTLKPAVIWLRQNNPFLNAYTTVIQQHNRKQHSSLSHPIPNATHVPEDTDAPPIIRGDVVVSPANFPDEAHNDDNYYSRLMVGFVLADKANQDTKIPIAFNDPAIEALVFPDIYCTGTGHYRDIDSRLNGSVYRRETYHDFIKHRLLNVDSRWRAHFYWPTWSYLQWEKLRNHQYGARKLRQNVARTNSNRLTANDLIARSIYTGTPVYNEDETQPLPSFIRTGDSYFHLRELHVNRMMAEYGLPTLFITLTMAESKWFHLQRILELTDNHDTQPTHRPLHCALHFTHRFQILKNKIWHNPAYTGWGKIVHHFERTEFQNRGAAHIHACYWTTENITTMIANHVIRSDMPDATKEPDLYNAVLKHQIHTCIPQKCGGPAPEGLQCRKGFPRKYSPVTYEDKERFRFVYHCVKREDQFVVPYHPATLLMWDAHMNIQYVTSKGLARYMTKYIAKPEPFHTFNIVDNDAYRQHVVGRRLGAMETMFLLLSLPICDSSDQVKFLSTEPPLTRQPSIKPLSLLINNPNEPFWTDSIEKYFARPNSSTFNNMLYVDYFSLYKLTTTRPRQPSKVMQDALGNFVVKRGKKLLIRLRPLSIRDGEHYFYQLLLCKIPARNESDLYNSYPTYRAHFLARYPEETQRLQENSSNFIHSLQERNSLHFHHALDELMSHLNNYIPQRAEQLIKTQLELLSSNPVIHPSAAMLNLPDDQYYALNVITHCLGPKSQSKHPYFFITGSAGTGKTFLIHMLCDLFKNQKKNYLLLAPTGVAAQHIGGHTIHSALRITSAGSFFKTAVLNDSSLRQQVADLDILIIDEISMVSAELFNYLSSLLAEICSNGHAFGGKCIIVVGDLFQLPPVSGEPVFHAACWKSFYPLFLKTQHRQLHDVDFYQTLEKIRVGNIDNETWNKLQNHYYKCKYGHPPVATNAHTSTPPAQTVTYISDPSCTTHLVGFRKDAYRINNAICEQIATKNGSFLIHEATDSVESEIQNIENSEKQFKTKTNLPAVVRLQPGVRVMYLNNTLFSHGICNGSIGIVTSVDPQQKKCTVLFSCQDSFKEIEVTPKYHSFYIDGHLCHRLQFPLQNAFAITVHKAQGLTLQHVTTFLDEQMFDFGQAYVSLSRATSWKNLSICSLSRDAFLTDKRVNGEYNRLQNLSSSSHPPFIIPHHIGTQ